MNPLHILGFQNLVLPCIPPEPQTKLPFPWLQVAPGGQCGHHYRCEYLVAVPLLGAAGDPHGCLLCTPGHCQLALHRKGGGGTVVYLVISSPMVTTISLDVDGLGFPSSSETGCLCLIPQYRFPSSFNRRCVPSSVCFSHESDGSEPLTLLGEGVR